MSIGRLFIVAGAVVPTIWLSAVTLFISFTFGRTMRVDGFEADIAGLTFVALIVLRQILPFQIKYNTDGRNWGMALAGGFVWLLLVMVGTYAVFKFLSGPDYGASIAGIVILIMLALFFEIAAGVSPILTFSLLGGAKNPGVHEGVQTPCTCDKTPCDSVRTPHAQRAENTVKIAKHPDQKTLDAPYQDEGSQPFTNSSQAIRTFTKERLVIGTGGEMSASKLYELFRKYCRERGCQPPTNTAFGRLFGEHLQKLSGAVNRTEIKGRTNDGHVVYKQVRLNTPA
jgi:hypothetical protein